MTSSNMFKHNKNKFEFEDKSGKFWLNRESGFKSDNKSFVVKREIFPAGFEGGKPLEQSVSISTLGVLNQKMNILRPQASQFVVWFDRKKYFNQLKFDYVDKSVKIKLISPEKEWSKIDTVDIPTDVKILCFFSQVMECASMTGFVTKAMNLESGVMNFHIVWDGYPYIQEQYPGVTQSLIARAKLKYDGILKKGENRFSLEVSGQSIFFIVNDEGKMIKKFWVAQGLSMVKR